MDLAPSDPPIGTAIRSAAPHAVASANDAAKPDAAWVGALVALLRFHRLAAEPAQIAQALTGKPSAGDMVRHLRRAGLRARTVNSSAPRLARIPLPAIALNDDGSCVLLARSAAERVLVLDPLTQQPKILPMAEFAAHWTGQLVLATRRDACHWATWAGASISLGSSERSTNTAGFWAKY
jgi:subfamily B ATP-binding cassette protein HlyB/CyaB